MAKEKGDNFSLDGAPSPGFGELSDDELEAAVGGIGYEGRVHASGHWITKKSYSCSRWTPSPGRMQGAVGSCGSCKWWVQAVDPAAKKNAPETFICFANNIHTPGSAPSP